MTNIVIIEGYTQYAPRHASEFGGYYHTRITCESPNPFSHLTQVLVVFPQDLGERETLGYYTHVIIEGTLMRAPGTEAVCIRAHNIRRLEDPATEPDEGDEGG